MTTVSSLVFPAVVGYVFLTLCNFTRFRASRQAGYHILFRSVVFGVGFYYVVGPAVEYWVSASYAEVYVWVVEKLPGPLTSTLVTSVISAVLAALLVNVVYSSERGAVKIAEDYGDNVELLINDAVRSNRFVEVTLTSRKVYVGTPIKSGVGSSSEADITLIPMYSGHRRSDDLVMVIDVNYTVLLRIGETTTGELYLPEDFLVSIPLSQIVSARYFDPEVFDTFNISATGPR